MIQTPYFLPTECVLGEKLIPTRRHGHPAFINIPLFTYLFSQN